MNSEQKLLIELLRGISHNDFDPAHFNDINWDLFIETAAAHRIIPSVFQKLCSFSTKVPHEKFDDLQNRAYDCKVQNLTFNAQLVKISELLKKNDIEFLSYKGSTLAQIAYGDAALRQFGDLDILIRKKDFPAVKSLFLENGGRCAWNLSAKQEKAVLRHYYEFPFRMGKYSILVEIHWAFMESFFGFDYNIEEVFRRRITVPVYGRIMPTLSNEDMLLVLCVHGSKHFWKRLSWIYDVGKLVQTQQIDWEIALKLAQKFGCLRMLALGLLLSQDFLTFDLPDEVQKLIEKDKETKTLASELKNQLFNNDFSADDIRSNLHLKMRERWRDKFTYSHRLFRTKLIDSLFLPMGRPQ